MAELKVVLRYFPVGDVAGPAMKITAPDLEKIAGGMDVSISLEQVKGKDLSHAGGNIREETMNSPIEQVSQSAITVTSGDETKLRPAIKELIKMYRSPRTVFGSWGSSPRGKEILAEICEAGDGWR
jgi:hypothetical protein